MLTAVVKTSAERGEELSRPSLTNKKRKSHWLTQNRARWYVGDEARGRDVDRRLSRPCLLGRRNPGTSGCVSHDELQGLDGRRLVAFRSMAGREIPWGGATLIVFYVGR